MTTVEKKLNVVIALLKEIIRVLPDSQEFEERLDQLEEQVVDLKQREFEPEEW